MYNTNTHRATRSNSLPSRSATYLDEVEQLRDQPDDMVIVSTVPDRSDSTFRFTLRNGHSFVVDTKALRWLLKHHLKEIQGDPLPALAAILARSLFRSYGGKKWIGVSFEDWMTYRA